MLVPASPKFHSHDSIGAEPLRDRSKKRTSSGAGPLNGVARNNAWGAVCVGQPLITSNNGSINNEVRKFFFKANYSLV